MREEEADSYTFQRDLKLKDIPGEGEEEDSSDSITFSQQPLFPHAL